MRFCFFYLMADDADRIRLVAPAHAAYWQELHLAGYLGGPFADRSGGLITFEAASLEDARKLVDADPFVTVRLLHTSHLNAWIPEGSHRPAEARFKPSR